MERWFGWRWMERWNEFHCCWRSSSSVPLGSLEEFAGGETTFEDPCEPKISHSAGGKDPAVGNTFPAVGLNHQKRKRWGKKCSVSCKVREESRCLKTTHCFHEKDWFHDWRIDINWPTFFPVQVDLEGSESGVSPEDPKVSRVLTYEGVLVSPMEEVGVGMRSCKKKQTILVLVKVWKDIKNGHDDMIETLWNQSSLARFH